jgi:hypothetical protein
VQEVQSEAIQNVSSMDPLWRYWKVFRNGSYPAYALSPWSEGVAVEEIRLALKHALEERLNYRLTRDGKLPDARVDLFVDEGPGLPVFKGTGINADIISLNTRINVRLMSGDELWMMPDPSLAWTALRVVKAVDDTSPVLTTQEMEEELSLFQAKRVQSVCLCLLGCVCVCVCVCVCECVCELIWSTLCPVLDAF